MNAVEKAARTYINRQSRREHPDGKFDNGGRWYPSETGRCECCDHVRYPSRRWPYSLMLHCRTAKHIANLYGVSARELKREAKRILNEENVESQAVMA